MNLQNPSERRQFKRVRFAEPVQLQFKNPNKFGACLSCDLSEGGIRVNLEDFVPPETDFILHIPLGTEKVVDCLGKVAWIDKLPYSERYQAGLEFTGFDMLMDAKTQIRRFIQTIPNNKVNSY